MTPASAPATPAPRRHIAFVVNTDWFFLSHRLPLAQEAIRRGWRVTLVAPDTGRFGEVQAHGIETVDLGMSRSGMNPVREAVSVARLARIYRRLRPDLIHHVTPKPVVFGSLAARAVPGVPVVNAVSGLGYAFADKSRWHPLPRIMRLLYRAALRRPRTWAIFQNEDDRRFFVNVGLIARERTVLIRGSGVDTAEFAPSPEPDGTPVVMMPARLLWDKGVREFVDAAERVRAAGVDARFAIAGPLDEGNPAAVRRDEVEAWVAEGRVEWWGNQTDMPSAYRRSTLVALPSYREGLPKALLEAGAAARARVTTDVPGCRGTVRHEETGLLVPAQDADGLADALIRLLRDDGLRESLRVAGRTDVEANYAVEHVVSAHVDVYNSALDTI